MGGRGSIDLFSHVERYHGLRKEWYTKAENWDVILFNLNLDGAVSELKVQGTMYLNLKHRRNIIGRRNEARDPTDFAREGDRIMWYVITHEPPYNPLLDALATM